MRSKLISVDLNFDSQKLRIKLGNKKILLKFYVYPLVLAGASWIVLVVKSPPVNAGDIKDAGLIPGSGRCPGVGNGNPFQY